MEDSLGHYSHRSSHSGPLVNRSQWTKARKNDDGTPKILATANLSALSGLVAAPSEKNGHLEAVSPSGRLSESGNDPSDNPRRYDQPYHKHVPTGSQRREDDRSSNMDPTMGYGPTGNKIRYSGPLLRPSGNVDQMLKDHDCQIQEVFRRSRLDKSKDRKIQGEGNQTGLKPFDLGVVPVYPSSRSSAPVFTSSRNSSMQ